MEEKIIGMRQKIIDMRGSNRFRKRRKNEFQSDDEEDIDLDLEEVVLENHNSGEVHNLMNEIEELKNIAIEKDNEVKQLKEMNLQAM